MRKAAPPRPCMRTENLATDCSKCPAKPGQALPDTLSSLLLGFPYAYTVAVAPPYASNGAHIGPAAINRNDVNAYIEDTWKINPEWTLEYGLRYELYTPISERAHRTSSFLNSFPPAGVGQE